MIWSECIEMSVQILVYNSAKMVAVTKSIIALLKQRLLARFETNVSQIRFFSCDVTGVLKSRFWRIGLISIQTEG